MSDDPDLYYVPCPGLVPHREARGLTQADLSAEIDYSRRQVQRFELEGQAPHGVLVQIAAAWGLSLEDLTQETRPGPDRELRTLAQRYGRALAGMADQHGADAYQAAQRRIRLHDLPVGALLPDLDALP